MIHTDGLEDVDGFKRLRAARELVSFGTFVRVATHHNRAGDAYARAVMNRAEPIRRSLTDE